MQIDIDKDHKNTTAMDIFTVGIPVYGYFKLKPDRIFNMDTPPKEAVDESAQEEEKEKEPVVITGYTEELVEIEGQWAYILSPKPIDPDNLPTLVIYNHGSITFVEENLDEDFKKDLIEYGEKLTPHNYIFAVSNARGFDLDTPEAIQDNYNMYEYIKEKYGIQEKIYMIGYSKGGVATLNFAEEYPNLVTQIAMIAPTMRVEEWDEKRAQKLKGVLIQIWHGIDDENISLGKNENFVEQMDKWGVKMNLTILEGRDHFDIEMESIDDVLDFFNN